ncbi:SDR family oxidoreductase [Amycolatopsis vancoresmycina]|uniref:Nucleotide-diphosphate-sugar epimerase/NmrA family protein n=1 Tax=Amycolatopsis vancoresmycina DSM 44592 TaxID=1292037 RepID=R1HT44_9PSEU|nr:SDR family oxidoreductase [Amycolatopsis vancoresmycina]EOD66750.1 nucleotide-diphosphate-sugar epimerase/NmrA family protein [Amycolatopsis vancoresmycina DSM 44592]
MIVVTGATGHLGKLVVEGLLEKLPADQVVAAVRTPEKAAGLAERGVEVRRADYTDPESLVTAFKGADKVLLVSSSEVGKRVEQHEAVIEAAKQAGVGHLVYTSAPRATTSALVLAPEHKATEELIEASGLTATILRNNWYHENYADTIKQAAETGSFVGSAGDGRVAGAARADYAAAAVAVLTGEGHEGKVYELAGDTAYSYADLAAEVGKATGRETRYVDLPADEHAKALTEAGLPEPVAGFLVALDANTRDGLLAETTADLRTLIGRPATPIGVTVAEVAGTR